MGDAAQGVLATIVDAVGPEQLVLTGLIAFALGGFIEAAPFGGDSKRAKWARRLVAAVVVSVTAAVASYMGADPGHERQWWWHMFAAGALALLGHRALGRYWSAGWAWVKRRLGIGQPKEQ